MLKEERQIVGIFINITTQQEHEKKLNDIRSQTIEQANELLEHQIRWRRIWPSSSAKARPGAKSWSENLWPE